MSIVVMCRQLYSTERRDKLDRSRSAKLTKPSGAPTLDREFITVIIKLCLQHDSVARLY